MIVSGVFVLPVISLPSGAEFARKAFGLGLLLFAGYPLALVAHYGLWSRPPIPAEPATPGEKRTIFAVACLAAGYIIIAAFR